jgi:hypothetical protein
LSFLNVPQVLILVDIGRCLHEAFIDAIDLLFECVVLRGKKAA